jgi:anti-anti-sigma factor
MSERQLKHVNCPVIVLHLTGTNINSDLMADEMRDEMLAVYLSAHGVNVVLDFQNVKYLSSSGFRPLLRLNRQVRERGGRLILCSLCAEVKEIFAVTRLISTNKMGPATFDVQADVATAVACLYQGVQDQPAEADNSPS